MKQIEQAPAAIVGIQTSSGEKGRLIDYYRSVSAGTDEVIFDDVPLTEDSLCMERVVGKL